MRSSRYEPYNSGPKNASCPNSAKSGLCGELQSYSARNKALFIQILMKTYFGASQEKMLYHDHGNPEIKQLDS